MPVYLRVNDRPTSSLVTEAYIWPAEFRYGLTVDVNDAVHEPPVVIGSAQFPVGHQMMTLDMAPTARMAFVLGTA